MYDPIFQYLLRHHRLALPGIGTIILERKPAQINFPGKQALPPAYHFTLQSPETPPTGKFSGWLSAFLQVSQEEAQRLFQSFASGLKNQLMAGDTVQWSGLGRLEKGPAGNITFTPDEPSVQESPVPANKVIREKAEHTVRVGEEEKTSVQMTEMLGRTENKRSTWWAWALGLGLLCVIFIGWYLSENGLDITSTANTSRLVLPATETATYTPVP